MTGYYVLFVWNDIEPYVYGPYDTNEERDQKALDLRKENGRDHGIFWLTIDSSVQCESYSGMFFKDVDDD